jgi:basic membrane lipoprotein Med (substrate-binding protein (PBP1-ABC) superfamily)
LSTIRWTTGLFILCILIILGGCGKNFPAIDPTLLDSKLSVLIISKQNLSDSTKATLQQTFISWRDTDHIAFDWMADQTALQEQQIATMKSMPYNYIMVIGNELNRQIAPIASTIPDKRWILIDDEASEGNAPINDKHIVWKQTGQGFMEQQWAEWVKQQQVLGKRIEWITVSTNLIPSVWAPSEEAETISLSDAQGWFSQFQTQVKQHGPSWIATYSPLEASDLQRVKNLRVPVIDISATSIELQWSVILNSVLQAMQKNEWKSGIQAYGVQEMQIIKP